MDSLTNKDKDVNAGKLMAWQRAHRLEIALFLVVLLAILAVTAFIRLQQIKPQKQPIYIEKTQQVR